MLTAPVAPTIHTMKFSSASTPRTLSKYIEAIALIVTSPPCIRCHHFKPFSEAIDASSHAISLWTLFGTDLLTIDVDVNIATYMDRDVAAFEVLLHCLFSRES